MHQQSTVSFLDNNVYLLHLGSAPVNRGHNVLLFVKQPQNSASPCVLGLCALFRADLL